MVPPGSKLKMPDGWNLFLRISLSMLSKIQGTSRTQQITRALGNSVAISGSFVHQRRVLSKTTWLSGKSQYNVAENEPNDLSRRVSLVKTTASLLMFLLTSSAPTTYPPTP